MYVYFNHGMSVRRSRPGYEAKEGALVTKVPATTEELEAFFPAYKKKMADKRKQAAFKTALHKNIVK